MKKLIAAIIVIASSTLFAQDNTLPTTGRVGVGTLTPSAQLDVNGNMIIDSCLLIKDSLIVNKAIRAMDRMIVEQKMTMKGDAIVKQDFRVNGNSRVDGDLRALGNLKVEGLLKLPNVSSLSNTNIATGNFNFLSVNNNGVTKSLNYADLLPSIMADLYAPPGPLIGDLIRIGNNSSPKTPFGDYNILANVDAEYQSGEIIELKPGTHIQAGAIAHLYISSMCYWIGGGRYMSMENDESNTNQTSDVRQEYSNAESWTIYPNPSTNKMTIKSKFAQKGDLLYIYTMMGNLLGKVELDKNNSASIKKLVGNHRFVLVQWHSNGVLKGTRKLIIQ